MEIYIAKNKTQMGPYDIGQVTKMLQAEILEKYDLYWHEGMLDWAPVGNLKMPNENSKTDQAIVYTYPQPNPQKGGISNNQMPVNNMGLVAGAIMLNSFRNEQIHQELHELNHHISEEDMSSVDIDTGSFGDF
jgi:hypothetical protein